MSYSVHLQETLRYQSGNLAQNWIKRGGQGHNVTNLIKFKGDYIKPNPPKLQLRMPNYLFIQFKTSSFEDEAKYIQKRGHEALRKKKGHGRFSPLRSLKGFAVGERSAAGPQGFPGTPLLQLWDPWGRPRGHPSRPVSRILA